MPHYIVRRSAAVPPYGSTEYQYPRRNNGRHYESRTTHGPDIGQARVFNTKGAAKNSSGGWGEVVEVLLKPLLPPPS